MTRSARVVAATLVVTAWSTAPGGAQQQVLVEGTVMCADASGVSQTRFATNTLVLPRGLGYAATVTNNVGYYPIRLSRREVVDRYLTLVFAGPDTSEVHRFFVGRESVGTAGNVRLPTVVSDIRCGRLEYDGERVDLVRDSILATAEPPAGGSGSRAGLSLGPILGTVVTLFGGGATAPCVGPLCGVGMEDTLSEFSFESVDSTRTDLTARVPLPSLRAVALLSHPGFRFSPTRDLGDAWLGNPAAVGLAEGTRIGTRFAPEESGQGHLSCALGDRARVGVGAYRMDHAQQLALDATWTDRAPPASVLDTLTVPGGVTTASDDVTPVSERTVKEEGLSVFGSYRVSRSLLVGAALRGTRRGSFARSVVTSRVSFDRVRCDPGCASIGPVELERREAEYVDAERWVDVDLGVVYRASTMVQLGGSVMTGRNGRSLEGGWLDATTVTAGLGATLLLGSVHLGADLAVAGGGDTDWSTGASWVPINHLTLRAGYDSLRDGWTAGVQVFGGTVALRQDYGSSDTTFETGYQLGF